MLVQAVGCMGRGSELLPPPPPPHTHTPSHPPDNLVTHSLWLLMVPAGKEDSIFKRQPNLLCNAFHWITNPEQRWPEHFWACDGVRATDIPGSCTLVTGPCTL